MILADLLSLPISMLRALGSWDITSKRRKVLIAYQTYLIIVRYVVVYPTIFLYVMQLTTIKDFEVCFHLFQQLSQVSLFTNDITFGIFIGICYHLYNIDDMCQIGVYVSLYYW